MAKDAVECIAEHYQKTYELTYELWVQRNRTFLILIGTIGAASLLTFQVPQANSLLVDLIAKVLGVTDASRVAELRKSFPFGILQSILLLVVFYLMVNLYHRACYVLRNYAYLGQLEHEIRARLDMSDADCAFTRESKFYWSRRSRLLGSVKYVYFLLLGVLLAAFLVKRTWDDVAGGSRLLAWVDLGIAVPTFTYFLAYAVASVRWDQEKRP